MARLEWAKMEVFDAAELPPLAPEHGLAGNILTLPIGLQPHVRLLKLAYPVDDWLVRLNREEWRAEASHAVPAEAPRNAETGTQHEGRLTPPPPRTTCVVVHRQDEIIFFKRVDHDAFLLLRAFSEGRSLGDACETLIATSTSSPAWWQRQLKAWFSEWTALRWLVLRGVSPNQASNPTHA